MVHRCGWEREAPDYVAYHDTEWGVPEHDAQALWEKLILDGFQAGLSWITILRKRDAFREAFADFDPAVVAEWAEDDVQRLLANPGIIRHRGKIEATITNARAYLEVNATVGFDKFLWNYVDGAPLQTNFASRDQVPPKTKLSEQLSKDLRARGFKFVGPTIVYAFMEATGLVNDHITPCFRHAECAAMGGPK
ncbi:DNA-3-methyladenine glycosylase I [uncultured Tateyamaria sp.]|uniref:DNA-3-methyladenine glycosylase I n=1 Tax=uncultured Tateyamaria sp. TaxID=455651 RepID=UPI0026312FFB|nr:DNA-3-methyladenine glycosylase I [uncultured Tateyamaria sp.]